MKTRRWIWVTLAVALVLVIAAVAVGEYFCNFAFRRMDQFDMSLLPPEGDTPADRFRMDTIRGNRRLFNERVAEWYPQQRKEKLRIESADGIGIAAEIIYAPEETHRYAILCHGYQGMGSNMFPHAYVFQSWGFNTMMPDWKSHGASDGKWIGMGWKDKDDLILWINEIIKRDPEAEIVLLGISMGGATVMMTSGMPELPENVVAVIDDCGYTNVWDVFGSQMKRLFGLPAFPVMHCASMMNRIHNGFFLDEADTVKMLRQTDPDLPMLFIHGELDAFVPVGMLDPLYEAKRGNKEKILFPDTDHGNSYVRDPELYFGSIRSFLERNGVM